MRKMIDMAEEAGMTGLEDGGLFDNFLVFEALVRADERNSWPSEMEAMERQVNILTDALAAEREACAKVCEETEVVQTTYCMTLHDEGAETLRNAAAAIRARSLPKGNT